MVKEDPHVAKRDPQRVGVPKLSLIDEQLIALLLIGGRGRRGVESWEPGIFSGRDWAEILILELYKKDCYPAKAW